MHNPSSIDPSSSSIQTSTPGHAAFPSDLFPCSSTLPLALPHPPGFRPGFRRSAFQSLSHLLCSPAVFVFFVSALPSSLLAHAPTCRSTALRTAVLSLLALAVSLLLNPYSLARPKRLFVQHTNRVYHDASGDPLWLAISPARTLGSGSAGLTRVRMRTCGPSGYLASHLFAMFPQSVILRVSHTGQPTTQIGRDLGRGLQVPEWTSAKKMECFWLHCNNPFYLPLPLEF
eukprot:2784623-Rhodomonas_salina.1